MIRGVSPVRREEPDAWRRDGELLAGILAVMLYEVVPSAEEASDFDVDRWDVAGRAAERARVAAPIPTSEELDGLDEDEEDAWLDWCFRFCGEVVGSHGSRAPAVVRRAFRLDRLFPRRDLFGVLGRAAELGCACTAYPGLALCLVREEDMALADELFRLSGIASFFSSARRRRRSPRVSDGRVFEALAQMIADREARVRRAEERADALEREAGDLRRERDHLHTLLAEARAAAPAPRPAERCPRCAHLEGRLAEAEAGRADILRELGRLQAELDRLRSRGEARRRRPRLVRRRATPLPQPVSAPAPPRLDGFRVVVVGHPNGQEGYRRAVEELGGEFVFLEGGSRVAELRRRVRQADAVVAAVGGMSHKAFYVIRSWCGASGTPFEPAASTGYAGVAAAARRLARRLGGRSRGEAGRGEEAAR